MVLSDDGIAIPLTVTATPRSHAKWQKEGK